MHIIYLLMEDDSKFIVPGRDTGADKYIVKALALGQVAWQNLLALP